jgi:hypothetical protein
MDVDLFDPEPQVTRLGKLMVLTEFADILASLAGIRNCNEWKAPKSYTHSYREL